MAFAIMRTTKIKTHQGVSSSMQHAQRDRETPNADKELTPQNEILVKYNPEDMQQKIEAARTRPDNVICLELLLTTSPEHWKNQKPADIDRRELEQWRDKNMEWVEKKFGKDNIASAIMHMDEKTPHLSVHVIPIDERGRLNCKNWTGGKAKMRELQDDFAEHLRPLGLERGERGSIAEHETVQEYYAKLEKVKAQTLEQNKDIILEVKGQNLPEPSMSDRLNITQYRDKVANRTLESVQSEVDKLQEKNKQLTAKLQTAENTIAKQDKELSRQRAILDKGRDKFTDERAKLKEYSEIKEALERQPSLAKEVDMVRDKIYLEKNPNVARYREYVAKTELPGDGIAYSMLKEGFTSREIKNAMIDDCKKPVMDAYRDVDLGEKYIAVEKEKAMAEAKAKAEQERAKAEQIAKEKAQQAYLDKNPHIKVYDAYKARGLNDATIAFAMMKVNKIPTNKVEQAFRFDKPDEKGYAERVTRIAKDYKLPPKSERPVRSVGGGGASRVMVDTKSFLDMLGDRTSGSSGVGGGIGKVDLFPLSDEELEEIEKAMERKGMSMER